MSFDSLAPIVITGRGGSGTRLLSRLMQDAELFLGNEINATEDSVEWSEPIYALASQEPGARVFGAEQIVGWRAHAAEVLGRAQATPSSASRAIAPAFAGQELAQESALWGWKLPETLLCLPEVFRAFPRARLLHLARHPVSLCLRRSHKTARLSNEVGRRVLQLAYAVKGLDFTTAPTAPDWLNNALSWDYQLRLALDFIDACEPSRRLTMRYEDICAAPQAVSDRIQAFLGRPSVAATLPIDEERRNNGAFDDERRLVIWEICGETAARLDYERDRPPACN